MERSCHCHPPSLPPPFPALASILASARRIARRVPPFPSSFLQSTSLLPPDCPSFLFACVVRLSIFDTAALVSVPTSDELICALGIVRGHRYCGGGGHGHAASEHTCTLESRNHSRPAGPSSQLGRCKAGRQQEACSSRGHVHLLHATWSIHSARAEEGGHTMLQQTALIRICLALPLSLAVWAAAAALAPPSGIPSLHHHCIWLDSSGRHSEHCIPLPRLVCRWT